MTNHWVDIKNADLILIMGGNAAEAHPCGFKWVTEAKAHNKARFIVVDPRFTRSASVADVYAPIRTGTDIVFLGGVVSYLLANDKIQHEYVKNYTDFPFIVRQDFAFNDGIYSGYDAQKHAYPDKDSWDYERGDDGIAGGGMNALRGHSNIQGLTDLGLMSNMLPGYMTLPMEAEQDYGAYIKE